MLLNTILTILLYFNIVINTYGQSNESNTNDQNCKTEIDSLTGKLVYHFSHKIPEPESGMIALYKKISKELKFSREEFVSKGIDIQKIVIGFVVDIDGKIIGKRILGNGHSSSISEQTFKIISNSNWIPGYCAGQAVPVLFIFPIRICLR